MHCGPESASFSVHDLQYRRVARLIPQQRQPEALRGEVERSTQGIELLAGDLGFPVEADHVRLQLALRERQFGSGLRTRSRACRSSLGLRPNSTRGAITETCAAEPRTARLSGSVNRELVRVDPVPIVERDGGQQAASCRSRRRDDSCWTDISAALTSGVALRRHRFERVERQQRRDLLEVVDDGEVLSKVREHEDGEPKPGP